MIIIPSYVKVVSKMFGMTECYNKTTAKVQTEQKPPKKTITIYMLIFKVHH